jgi:segregation and condensation protein A
MQGPTQEEMPFAIVRGEAVNEPPKDLYIPPEAMEVFLDAFEGPLDLLLYLIPCCRVHGHGRDAG